MRSIALLVVACSTVGCASNEQTAVNQPPIIDRITMNDHAVLGADGFYEVQGWVSAHDPDGVIETLVVRPRGEGPRSFATGPTPIVTDFPVVIRWVAKADVVGPYEFALTVRDDELVESAAIMKQASR